MITRHAYRNRSSRPRSSTPFSLAARVKRERIAEHRKTAGGYPSFRKSASCGILFTLVALTVVLVLLTIFA